MTEEEVREFVRASGFDDGEILTTLRDTAGTDLWYFGLGRDGARRKIYAAVDARQPSIVAADFRPDQPPELKVYVRHDPHQLPSAIASVDPAIRSAFERLTIEPGAITDVITMRRGEDPDFRSLDVGLRPDWEAVLRADDAARQRAFCRALVAAAGLDADIGPFLDRMRLTTYAGMRVRDGVLSAHLWGFARPVVEQDGHLAAQMFEPRPWPLAITFFLRGSTVEFHVRPRHDEPHFIATGMWMLDYTALTTASKELLATARAAVEKAALSGSITGVASALRANASVREARIEAWNRRSASRRIAAAAKRPQGRVLRDFGRFLESSADYAEAVPRTLDEVVDVVRSARAPIRVRGAGHSMNGVTLPASNELLLRTDGLKSLRFDKEGTVTAGAGVSMWALREIVEKHGYTLPVINDGDPGPTVGGYIAAGGIGPGSREHGGFWDNVDEVSSVAHDGSVHRMPRDHRDFRWLFGSMGQLGITVEARVDIIALPHARYPLGLRQADETPTGATSANEPGLYWFTLFVPPDAQAAAHAELDRLEREFRSSFAFESRYDYPILRRRFIPPLLYDDVSFLATGVWGYLLHGNGVDVLRRFSDAFTEVTRAHGWRRYYQTEFFEGALNAVRQGLQASKAARTSG